MSAKNNNVKDAEKAVILMLGHPPPLLSFIFLVSRRAAHRFEARKVVCSQHSHSKKFPGARTDYRLSQTKGDVFSVLLSNLDVM